jgi:hypothetical protein
MGIGYHLMPLAREAARPFHVALFHPRDGASIDLIGKFHALRIECSKCGQAGRYHIAKARRAARSECQAVRVVGRADGGLPARRRREQPAQRLLPGFAEDNLNPRAALSLR